MSDKRLSRGLLERIRSRQLFGGSTVAMDDEDEASPAAGGSKVSDVSRSSVSDNDDSIALIPDTPSPVFIKKGVVRPKTRMRYTEASKETLNSRLSRTERNTRTERSAALQRLQKRRQRQNTREASKSESDEEKEITTSASNALNVSVEDDDEDDVELPAFPLHNDKTSMNVNPEEIDKGATSSSSAVAGCSNTDTRHKKHFRSIAASCLVSDSSDSTDIDESDFDDFINGLMETRSKRPASKGNVPAKTPEQPQRKRVRGNGTTPIACVKDISVPQTDATDCGNDDDDIADDINILVSLDTMEPPIADSDSLMESDQVTRDNPPVVISPRRRNNFNIRTRRSKPPDRLTNPSGASDPTSNLSGAARSETSSARRRRLGHVTSHMISTPTFSLPTTSAGERRCRSGSTSTLTRVSGLRRRGNRSRGVVSSNSLVVSPDSAANHQVAEDEAMARRLQEELDREFAVTLAASGSPAPSNLRICNSFGDVVPPGGTAPSSGRLNSGGRPLSRARASAAGSRPGMCRQRVAEAASNYDTRMFMTIGGMSDYEWEVHQAVFYDRDAPTPPANTSDRPLDEILNPEVLDFLEHYQYQQNYRHSGEMDAGGGSRQRRLPAIERSPLRPVSRSRRNTRSMVRPSATATSDRENAAQRLRDELDYETSMLMRIGGMSDQDWSIHQAVYNADEPTPDLLANRTLEDILDPEVLSFMTYNSNRRRHEGTRGRQRGRRAGHASRHTYDTSFNNDYEYLLNLAETIGDAKPRGLTDHQVAMLPTKVYRESEVKDDGVRECNICFSDYEEGDSLRLLQCFHYFHADCVDRWLKENPSCPICRVEVTFE